MTSHLKPLVLLALNVLENIDLIKNVLVLGKPKQNS
jgi:hypothetical protein